MPIVNPEIYGRHRREDNQPGYQEVTATTQAYVEEDKTDVRLNRVRVFNKDGVLAWSYLRDTMGVRFVDNLGLDDDTEYVRALIATTLANFSN